MAAVRRDGTARVVLVLVLALLVGLGVLWSAVGTRAHGLTPGLWLYLAVAVVVGWSLVGSGLLSWRPGPAHLLGPVLVLTGFAWLLARLGNSNSPLLFTTGELLGGLYTVGFVYLVLSFPSGRLQGRLDSVVVAVTVFLVTVVQLVWLLFADSERAVCGPGCPTNLLEVTRNDAIAIGAVQVQRAGALAVVVAAVVLLASRWRRASRAQRRAVQPVVLASVVAFTLFTAWMVTGLVGLPVYNVLGVVAFYAACAVPVAVLVVFAQRRLARGAVAGLIVELGAQESGLDLRGALARALDDPSLSLAYWFPAESRYVDNDGRPVQLPDLVGPRRATVIERGGRPVAALVHDTALEHNAALVQSVCAAAGLSLENERLQAELRARLVELQASRARLVEATDAERRRIERDLHDGTQQRLVSIAMSLGLLESTLPVDAARARPVVRETRDALAAALAELRDLTQGIHPAVLAERGLPGGLDELCRRAALPAHLNLGLDGRLPEQIETAGYFFVSEALTNAAKHSHATEVRVAAAVVAGVLTVEVSDDGIGGASPGEGSGLRGLADRVEALGGRLTVSSPPGRGTRLLAELPCG